MNYEFLTEGLSYVEGHLLPTENTISAFKEVYDIVQPKRILEIGFNAGHSAYMSLEMLPDVQYRSLDICRHKYTEPNGKLLEGMYEGRFYLQNADSKTVIAESITNYDLIFIDGDHSVDGLTKDIHLAKDAGIEYILVDDYHPKWFQNVIDLVDHFTSKDDFGYEKVQTIDYDSRDGLNTAILLRKIK